MLFQNFGRGGFLKVATYAAITFSAYICVGLNRSYTAFLNHYLSEPDSIIKITDEQKSWLASSIGYLSPVGSLFSGTVMDFFGRKVFLSMIFIPFAISWLTISLAKSYTVLLLGMMLQGLGGGMSSCVSVYISEISSREHRGALLGFITVAYNCGVLICNLLNYNFMWNVSSIVCLCISITFMAVTITFLPESPVWLHSKGRTEEAIEILSSLRGADRDKLESEIKDMEKRTREPIKTTFSQTFKNIRKAWKQLLVITVLFVLMQHTGYSIMIAYTLLVFDRLNLPLDSSKITVLYSTFGFISSFTTPIFMHRFGRKTVLSVSSLGMAIAMVIVGVYEELFYYESTKMYVWIVPIAFYVYVFACNTGVYPIGFIIGGEVFPTEVRGTMNGIYGVFSSIYWVSTLKLYPKVMFYFGIKTMIWSFAVSSFILCLYGKFLLPETKGKTLNEIQEQYFQRKKPTGKDVPQSTA
ncbi:facilitated trehalose transporter Tret1-like [Planococcus citri]|uniref:facilitated trehalose transporter Tret1-like n=1 Tax=Planococcus citri TaxID=170843 RepID=UPI0031F997F0